MWRRLLMSLLAGVLVPAVAGAAIVTITVANFSFTPNDITIGQHDTVHWVWANGCHTVTSGVDNFDPNAGNLFNATLCAPGTSFDYTFDTPGDFQFFCSPHVSSGMTGVIRVATTGVQPTAWAKIKALYH